MGWRKRIARSRGDDFAGADEAWLGVLITIVLVVLTVMIFNVLMEADALVTAIVLAVMGAGSVVGWRMSRTRGRRIARSPTESGSGAARLFALLLGAGLVASPFFALVHGRPGLAAVLGVACVLAILVARRVSRTGRRKRLSDIRAEREPETVEWEE